MNPYAPPKAELAEPQNSQFTGSKRPWSVSRAVWLICASLALGVLKIFLAPLHGPLWFALLIVAVLVGFTAAIANGKNWARVIFLVFFTLGLPGIFLVREQLLQEGAVSIAVLVFQTILQLAAVVLLFLPSSNGWFRKRHKLKEQNLPEPVPPAG